MVAFDVWSQSKSYLPFALYYNDGERRLRERGTEVYTDNQTEIDRYWYVPSQTAGSLN